MPDLPDLTELVQLADEELVLALVQAYIELSIRIGHAQATAYLAELAATGQIQAVRDGFKKSP